MTDSEATAILESQQSIVKTLKNRVPWSQEFKKWRRDTRVAIEKIFGDKCQHTREFTGVRYSPQISNRSTPDAVLYTVYLRGLESADALLASMIDEIKQYGLMEKDMVSWEECLRVWKHVFDSVPRGTLPDSGNIIEVCKELDIDELTAKEIGNRLSIKDYIKLYPNGDFYVKQQGLRAIDQISNESNSIINNRKIFVVHGHNEALRETVARFLERLELSPIILHEQPNRGRTIIEKFTDYSDVCFAVVLLTADDLGRSKAAPSDSYQPRARQNVILELGFFLGKLGRDNVCALYEKGVEIPSDYQGVLFIEADNAGAWRLTLAREIKAGGIEIDLNKAVS